VTTTPLSATSPVTGGRASRAHAGRQARPRAVAWPAALRWSAVVLVAAGLVVMHAMLGTGPAHSDVPTRTMPTVAPAVTTATNPGTNPATNLATPAVTSAPTGVAASTGHATTSSVSSADAGAADGHGHDCDDCADAHGASLVHLCLAVVGGLLLAVAGLRARRRPRLPALDLDVRWLARLVAVRGQAVAGVPPWSHLSLAQLSLLRV